MPQDSGMCTLNCTLVHKMQVEQKNTERSMLQKNAWGQLRNYFVRIRVKVTDVEEVDLKSEIPGKENGRRVFKKF